MAKVFDLESNGLLPDLTTIHCMSIMDTTTRKVQRFNSQKGNIRAGLRILEDADMIIGHNIMDFDIPAIQKVYPGFKPKGIVRDTLVISKLIWTDLKDRDFSFARKNPNFPKHLIGGHALKAWGHRLSNLKDDYTGGWESWNQEMDDYCEQDVRVTMDLWDKIESKNYSEEAIQLEHDVWRIIRRQIDHGFAFNKEAAKRLYVDLLEKQKELREKLQVVFKPWWSPRGTIIPKRNDRRYGYHKGAPLTKVELTEFNPGSRDHISNRLMKIRGWKPSEFGNNGKPTVDESILSGLKYPEAPLLVEYLTVGKRLGQLAEGKEAWIKAEKDGRIHGRVQTNGAVTGRMTHQRPNMAQVPAVKVGKDGHPIMGLDGGYGYECRSLFTVPIGKKQVGADASGLELRCLAHYMAKWDHGSYVKEILEGDIHTANQIAAGLKSRADAKTFIYAFLYGAGDAKIGSIIGKGSKAGRELKRRFLGNLPALNKLIQKVQEASKSGSLPGLDGRRLHVRSTHAALNTLLQGAGAIIMKQALVILDNNLQAAGYTPGVDYEFVANIHDEWQIETKEEVSEDVGKYATKAIRLAGDHFGFRCPLDGEYKVGRNWAETH